MRIYGEARTLRHLIFEQRHTPVPPFVHITRVTNQNFGEMKKKQRRQDEDHAGSKGDKMLRWA